MQDRTHILAAEPYLSLTPHDGLMRILKEYGGYDTRLAENIIRYPSEPLFTQHSNAKSSVMASVVKMSQLMLLFYRDQCSTATGASNHGVMQTLGVGDPNILAGVLRDSAGKVRAASSIVQQDFIGFVQGQSQFLLRADVNGAPMDQPLIRNIGDFQSHASGQEILETFVQLCNQRERGSLPSGWQTAGGILNALLGGVGELGDALDGFRRGL